MFLIYFFQRMDTRPMKYQKDKIQKRQTSLTLRILNLPSKSFLLSLPSPSSDYILYHHIKKKINMAVVSFQILKPKLYANLEIYQWRKQTDFPIVKTHYVSVKNNGVGQTQTIPIQVFSQHCPLKLNHIYEMSIAQVLYLIKECLIGFERLFNRFGGFQITEGMIAINEKGYCKVWMNQNFALNSFVRQENRESRMVNTIINMIQSHCIQSKNSKRLFTALNKCSNFLQSLKMIDAFVITEKILVPNRFSFSSFSSKPSKKQLSFESLTHFRSIEKLKNAKSNNISLPMTPKKNRRQRKKQVISQQKDYRLHFSPQHHSIKRFKSEDKMRKIYDMKISAGQTACSTNNKDIKASGNSSYAKEVSICKTNQSYRSERRKAKWIEQPSFVMDFSVQNNALEKQKKQLSQSEANIMQPQCEKDRKFSTNLLLQENLFFKQSISMKECLGTTEISHIINDQENSGSKTPRKIIQEEEQNQKIEHSTKILKSNGWKNHFHTFLDSSKPVNQSIHGGEEETSPKEVKLEKLGKLANRKMTMSILHQQHFEDFP